MKKRGNGEGSVYQRKNGTWRASLQIGTTDAGKPIRKEFTAQTEREVRKKLRAYIRNGHKSDAELRDKMISEGKFTLEDGLNNWLINIHSKKISENSYLNYKHLASTINSYIGHYMVYNITVPLIENELIGKLHDDGYKDNSIKHMIALLRMYLEYYIDTYDTTMTRNPARKVTVKSGEVNQCKYLSEQEINSLLGALTRPYIDLIIKLVLFTGLRLGEAVGLTVDDYDPKYKVLHVRKTETRVIENGIVYRKVLWKTKTKAGNRYIPLCSEAVDIIEQLISIAAEDGTVWLAHKRSTPQEPMLSSSLTAAINKRYKKAGIKQSGMHVLRHTYATALFDMGVPVKVISDVLGHSDIGVTLDTYVHVQKLIKFKAHIYQKFKPWPVELTHVVEFKDARKII